MVQVRCGSLRAVALLGFCAVSSLLSIGCRRDAPAVVPDTTAVPTTQAMGDAEREFQRHLEGIWATQRQRGDDAETIFAIEWSEAEAGLRMLHDGQWLSGTLEDVDLGNRRLAWHVDTELGPEETITLRKVPDEAEPEAFSLEVTWANGQSEALGFVPRLTARDRKEIATAIEAAKHSAAMGDGPEKNPACEGEHDSLRLRLICNDQEWAMTDRRLVLRLDEMKTKQPDGEKTEAAALRQIDACRTKKCLEDAYAEWEQYLDENFDLSPEVE